jgi:predicted nucleotide-binding protein
MKNCTSGIFIFTADEERGDANGNKVYRPSDNVVYELGAASVLYGNKIVIFKEEDVTFASDFSDIGYISFEKDRLDAMAADLMMELINLGFMQLTPT